jgi:hypothetical protein
MQDGCQPATAHEAIAIKPVRPRLVPQKRGPQGPHKFRGEALAFVEQQLVTGELVRARELAKLVRQKFDLKIHRRTIERFAGKKTVIENIESTKRQYALCGRAIALGWHHEQIIVIDNDQGESGASAAWREGFQRLVTDVGMSHAGIVMGLEVSRLARNNADW